LWCGKSNSQESESDDLFGNAQHQRERIEKTGARVNQNDTVEERKQISKRNLRISFLLVLRGSVVLLKTGEREV
jgi:hypothetical protein